MCEMSLLEGGEEGGECERQNELIEVGKEYEVRSELRNMRLVTMIVSTSVDEIRRPFKIEKLTCSKINPTPVRRRRLWSTFWSKQARIDVPIILFPAS